jgi:Family of unknown function (DUF6807)
VSHLPPVVLSLVLAAAQAPQVAVVPSPKDQRVDVLVDGKPFTSYVWPTVLKKPVLYPLRSPRGTLVTRGYPLDPRPGERVDHPHHVGLWLNYGDVSGIDFWNNSEARAADAAKMGTVVHRRVAEAKGGAGQGVLEVEADWVMPDGSVSLEERTRYIFRAEPEARLIDRITTLTARARTVLGESKEGLLGIRVARELEHPADKHEVFTDASGRPSAVPVLDNKGVTGVYLSSEGLKGDAVWGTRARWVTLTGKIGDEEVTVAILDHPRNPNHPTYWHARGYGLFAANPIAAQSYRKEDAPRKTTLEPKESLTLRYRIVLRSRATPATEAESDWKRFTEDVH